MATKRFEGRDEPIIEPGIPIVDAHHHLFDRPGQRYMLDEYLEDAGAGHNIVASVYIETLAFARPSGPELMRPIGEIEFAVGAAAMAASQVYGTCDVCAAIVGYADLRVGDAIAPFLDRALELSPDRFRGVRQLAIEHPDAAPFRFVTHPPPPGILASPGFRPAFHHLAERDLSFDAAVFHHQLPDVAALADAFPTATIILNHMGLAMAMELDEMHRREVFQQWRALLSELARRPNIVCKIGGLGLPFWGFGFETRPQPASSAELAQAWRPYVLTAIEAFGVSRCMMESNYPPDARSCGFVPLWNALKRIVQDFSAVEKTALFNSVAAKTYKLVLHAPSPEK
jgi:predicted TIM-barrel fold metal-dependent hydrolase